MGVVRHVVRSASLRGLPELARSLGVDPYAALRRVGLPRRCLDDPEMRVGTDKVARLLESVAAESGVDSFGVRLAANRQLSHLGPVAFVLRQEPTGLQALETLCRYLSLMNTSLVTRLESHGGIVVIAQDLQFDRPVSARQSIELAVGVMYRLLSDVLGPAWRPRGVGFAHRAPRDRSAHRALFRVAVDFDAGFNGVVCNRADLEARLPRTDPDTARYARASLERTLGQVSDDPVLAVRRLIVLLLPGGRCTVDAVAQQLGVDRRTVHRRLQAQGETFTGLLAAVRREFAVRQLTDSDRGVAEIAAMLGFSGSSAFGHWFTAAFGCSALAWRRRQGGARPKASRPSGTLDATGL